MNRRVLLCPEEDRGELQENHLEMVVRLEMPNPPTQLVALYLLQFCVIICYIIFFVTVSFAQECDGSVFLNFHLSVLIESLECCSPMWDLAGKDILPQVFA